MITNYHVIAEGGYRITTYQGKMCMAKLKYQDTKLDLALITSDCTGTPLKITESYSIGQTVLTAGNPSKYDFVVSKGIVSGEKWQMIQFDARVTTGSSGGALVNLRGQVIGVIKGQDKEVDYINFAVSGKELIKFLDRAR